MIEGRGVTHHKVTKGTLKNAWGKRRNLKTAWRFRTGKHNLSSRWTDIMLERPWVSTTPEAFRGNIATWAWVRQYYSMAELGRPPFGRARLSTLLTVGSFREGPSGVLGLCVGQCTWGGLYLPFECVQGRFYIVKHNVAFCHAVFPLQWRVYTAIAAKPLTLQTFHPGVFRN